MLTRGRSGGLWERVGSEALVAAIAAVVLGLDQLTKYLVRANLAVGESLPREGLFRITHGTNTGTIFGLFPDQTLILTIASIIAIGFIVYFYRTQSARNRLSSVNIGLLLGGAFGTLIDRLVAGRVPDFIDIGPWPIFNIADSSIVMGITMMIAILALFGDGLKSEPEDENVE